MKNCACIAEYNPLHNGHLKLISHIKNELKAETLTVILSGDFCERGENAVIDKYTRAKHAVYAGADNRNLTKLGRNFHPVFGAQRT